MKPFVPKDDLDWFKKFIKINNQENAPVNAYWSSDSSLESVSEAESQLSQ